MEAKFITEKEGWTCCHALNPSKYPGCVIKATHVEDMEHTRIMEQFPILDREAVLREFQESERECCNENIIPTPCAPPLNDNVTEGDPNFFKHKGN